MYMSILEGLDGGRLAVRPRILDTPVFIGFELFCWACNADLQLYTLVLKVSKTKSSN